MGSVNVDLDWHDVKGTVEQNGFVFLPGWKPELSTDELLSDQALATRFDPTSRTHQIIPRAYGPPNSYSGQYGLSRFPAHSDMAHWPEPPRYIWLRCRKGSDAVITFLFDGNDIVARCSSNLLVRSLVRARRPLAGRLSLMSLYQPSRGEASARLRWDEAFIVPACETAIRGMKAVRQAIGEGEPIKFALAARGDTLVVDNWRMLHGRSAVPEACRDRIIERAYLRSLH
jgi:hypothetical protein